MKDFRSVDVWKKSHELVLAVYKASAGFPSSELYGLTSQVRRAASSIPANIAEGCGRGSDRDFARFLQIAMGSASELEYHLILARDLGFLDDAQQGALEQATTEVKRMLTGFMKKLKADR
ncbi:four helix bundle protein [Candidatus Bipolaricaulota bacterium]